MAVSGIHDVGMRVGGVVVVLVGLEVRHRLVDGGEDRVPLVEERGGRLGVAWPAAAARTRASLMPSSWANAGNTCSTTVVLAGVEVVTSLRKPHDACVAHRASASAMRFSPSLAFVKPDMATSADDDREPDDDRGDRWDCGASDPPTSRRAGRYRSGEGGELVGVDDAVDADDHAVDHLDRAWP